MKIYLVKYKIVVVFFFIIQKDIQLKNKLNHLRPTLSQKRAELSALTQNSEEESAKAEGDCPKC